MANNFTHNQFRNPTNQGIYYSDHFHNLDTSISFSHSHNNIININLKILKSTFGKVGGRGDPKIS